MNIQFFAGEGKEKDNIKALRENRAVKSGRVKTFICHFESRRKSYYR